MAKGKLYEFAVLHHPTPEKGPDGKDKAVKSSIVVQPTSVLAGSPDEVSIMAAKKIPDDYNDKLDEVEIVVRPF